jgi:hypothetical protein
MGGDDLLNLQIERDVFDEGFSEFFYVAEVLCGVLFSCSVTTDTRASRLFVPNRRDSDFGAHRSEKMILAIES